MNLEQLQAMSDNELNDMSAIKVMGWNCNIVNRVVQVWSDVMGRQIKVASDWNPTTDMNDAMELWDKLNETGVDVKLERNVEHWKCITIQEIDGCNASTMVKEKTAHRAITIASILAKEE